jgi:hypothetical protein
LLRSGRLSGGRYRRRVSRQAADRLIRKQMRRVAVLFMRTGKSQVNGLGQCRRDGNVHSHSVAFSCVSIETVLVRKHQHVPPALVPREPFAKPDRPLRLAVRSGMHIL